jgi:MFS family permease
MAQEPKSLRSEEDQPKMNNVSYYVRVLVVGAIAGTHLAVMDMFKVSFQSFLEDLHVIKGKNSSDIVLEEYSKIYSLSALLDIPCTLFWGYFTDRFGTAWSLNIQVGGTVGIFILLSMCTNYSNFYTLLILSTVFDKYIIALDTFLDWVPGSKLLAYLKFIQLTKSILMQSGPFLGGVLVSVSSNHIQFYYRVLACFLISMLVAFNLLFVIFPAKIENKVKSDLPENPEEVAIVNRSPEVEKVSHLDDEEDKLPNKRDTDRYMKTVAVSGMDDQVDSPHLRSIEVESGSPPASGSGGSTFSWVYELMMDATARHLILLGLFLRMAKKYVDYGFHLWAEISRTENGLGLSKLELGTLSSSGGILSVLIFFLVFTKSDVSELPHVMRRSFLLLSLTIMAFPFLIFLSGSALKFGVFSLVLLFMVNEAILFTSWVGLLNTCLPKEVRARSYSLSLAVKGVIGFACTVFIFRGFKSSLESKFLDSLIGPLNSIIFFWGFALSSLGMMVYYSRLKVSKSTDGSAVMAF